MEAKKNVAEVREEVCYEDPPDHPSSPEQVLGASHDPRDEQADEREDHGNDRQQLPGNGHGFLFLGRERRRLRQCTVVP